MSDEILYEVVVPYPWKKKVRGLYVISVFVAFLATLLTWDAFIHIRDPPQMQSFLTTLLLLYGLIAIFTFAMRYVQIHGDKIKEPLRFVITKDSINSYRGSYLRRKNPLTDIKDVNIVLTNKKVLIDVNYKRPKGTELGWIIQFRANTEFENIEDFKSFLNTTYPRFENHLLKRIKELNADVKIVKRDKRWDRDS